MTEHTPEEVKLLAVRYYLLFNQNYVQAANIFNCSARSLERWVKKYADRAREKYKFGTVVQA